MDQSSLTALLQQLQGLDPPPPSTATIESGEDGEIDQVEEQDQPESARQPASPDEVAPSLPESELERLLHSLRPLEGSQDPTSHNPTHDNAQYTSYDLSYPQTSAYYPPPAGIERVHPLHPPKPAATVQADIRKFTFAQALPVISRLAADSDFLEQLQQIKTGQEAFELSIVDERNRAKSDLEKQLKRAQDAAEASGVSYEVDRLRKLLTTTLTRFDKDALTRWDALARDQQAKLEQLGVPCFFVLKGPDPVAQERQRRVMETLMTLLDET